MVEPSGIGTHNLADSATYELVFTAVVEVDGAHGLFIFAEFPFNNSLILRPLRGGRDHRCCLFNMFAQPLIIMNRLVIMNQGLRCPANKSTAALKGIPYTISTFRFSHNNRRMAGGRLIYHRLGWF